LSVREKEGPPYGATYERSPVTHCPIVLRRFPRDFSAIVRGIMLDVGCLIFANANGDRIVYELKVGVMSSD